MSHHTHTPKIGLAVATIVGMNAMIGAGIFSVPAALASNVGPAGIITYAFVIIAVWCMGTSFARLAQLFPEEGSFYVYAKQWGGHAMGLIAAGSYLIGLMIAMGLLAQVAGIYLHDYFAHYVALSQFSWGAIVLLLLTALNMYGVKLSEIGQIILICLTVFPLITITLLCLTKADFNNLYPFMPFGLQNIFAATRAVIFGFFGFECASSLFSIVKNPEKNVSKALTLAILFVGSLYMLFVCSLILAVPLKYFSITEALPKTLAVVFPNNKWLLTSIYISILSAVLGTLHSMIWSASALIIAYLKRFKCSAIHSLAHSKWLTQSTAVFFLGCCIFVSFATLKNIDLFFSLTSIFIVFALSASIITLLTLKKEWQSGNNIKAVIGLLTAAVILYFAIEGLLNNL